MKRRSFLGRSLAIMTAPVAGQVQHAVAAAPQASAATTFLVAHGAWSAGWSWKKMHPLMAAAGHRLITPTCTGLGERDHLANPSIDLQTHVQDLLGVIKYEQLNDIVLVAHSYGGMVATGVVDRVPERIRKLIYVDAFVPKDGQSLMDLVPAAAAQRMREGAKAGDGWRVPPNQIPSDTSPEDVAWLQGFRVPQPIKTFESPVRLAREPQLPRAYISCKRSALGDTFKPFLERAQREGWPVREIEASHSAQVTAPEELARLLQTLA